MAFPNSAPSIYRRSMGLTVLLLAILLSTSSQAHAGKSPYDWALIRLDYARKEKVERLEALTGRLADLARQAATDELVQAFFAANLEYARTEGAGPVPDKLAQDVARIRKHFDGYYIEHYFAFYDILFISPEGDVFYTMRKEADIGDHLFEPQRAGTPLGRCLTARPQEEVFVDFHDYGPSSEAAAFFVEPLFRDGAVTGWIALQWAINKLNSVFAATEDLGQTGETFLVNRDGLMLTESYFEGASTILRKHLAERNVEAKFRQGNGHRTVTDYRDKTALSSFAVFGFLGVEWLVVAKIDRDEITTDHYARHRRYYTDKVLETLRGLAPPALRDLPASSGDGTVRVDMDEFLRAGEGATLETWGVSTCTALLAAYPGRFAYLAHISPKDRLYGGTATDLLAQMTKRILGFDIYPCERRDVQFVVVAPHLRTLPGIIDGLLDQGFLLSQIHVLHNPEASSAALRYAYGDNSLEVRWKKDGAVPGKGHTFEDAWPLDRVVETLVASEGDHPA